ncbi:CHAT domain-containing protein [Stigmatella aurantiaca]|uniref:CHAT domain-containing protein n=1 Tax=Stigmatella aurantiaca TaxID=41 RepID=A0A1H7WP60_STIAU|nr:CHAT domain-containing tetratricopeptide repeat protein [Stigmatella aurantiaca]SEM22829.1 CHAT domain-containing protein [Stigmatella aurantiaca]
MRLFTGWMLAVFLCCAAESRASGTSLDARLVEAQADYDEAQQLKTARKYTEALVRAEHALTLRKAALGEMHPTVALCLNLLGNLHRRQGDFAQAEPLFLRALAIREATLGQDHPEAAYSLNSLAILYMEQGLYNKAEPLLLRALAIWESAFTEDTPDIAGARSNLAALYWKQGRYRQAEPLYLRALSTSEAAFGKDHPHAAGVLTNLATLYFDQGLYGQAAPLFQRAITILESAFGKTHLDLAVPLDNLAILYAQQGLYGSAESLHKRALTIMEANLDRNSPEVASSLNELASLYSRQGLYGQAEPLLRRSLAISERTFGKNHPDVASSLNNLADLHTEQGAYAKAMPLFRRSLSIREASLGKAHPDVADSLLNLASTYRQRGLYGRAEPLYQRSLDIMEMAAGQYHPFIAQLLTDFALSRLAQQRLPEALALFTRAFSISERRLRQEALGFSGSRLSSLLSHLRADEQMLYALLRAYPQDAHARNLALSAVLLLKGRSVAELAHISRSIDRNLGAEDHDTLEKLRGLRTQLAALSFSSPDTLPLKAYQQRLKALEEEGDSLEAELAGRSAHLRSLTALPSPSEIVARVAAALPQDSALIEFIAYRDRPLVPKPGTSPANVPSQLRYMALVLFPDGASHTVDLGPAAPIDRAALHLRDALAEQEASFQTIAQELYQRAFQPLIPLLGSTRHLVLAPDGQLGLIPFDALHDGQGFLLDSFDFTYLTSGRELLLRPWDGAAPSSVVVMADPNFTDSVTALDSHTTRSSPLAWFAVPPLSEMPRNGWVRLPGTRLEAQSIQRLLPQAQLFLGADASKDVLLRLPTPGILHLATHGFFLGDAPAFSDARGLASIDALAGAPPPQQEPLLNSGLVLAGAQASGAEAPGPEATLLTALEIAGLNLWGTQLVVLSGCDTGRGDVRLGQGVYGLRRALVAAGAETVLVSLWKVNDYATSVLMEAYYRNLLKGQGRATALREAMKSHRARYPHPHAWAPFIALGRNTPLRGITPALPQAPEPGASP